MIAQIQNVLQCAIAHIYVRLQIAKHICMHQAELAALQLFNLFSTLSLQFGINIAIRSFYDALCILYYLCIFYDMHFVFCIICILNSGLSSLSLLLLLQYFYL